MTTFNLENKRFSPVVNSEGGRVSSGAVFVFTQTGDKLSAVYSGGGVSDGHIIGRMTSQSTAVLLYHSRAKDGSLEAGQADVIIHMTADDKLAMEMNWTWLNGSKASGTSRYKEIS